MCIITNSIIATCTRTKDSTEQGCFHCIIFRKDFESSAIDRNCAIAIERVINLIISTITTACTSTIKFRNNHFTVVYFSLTISWVNKDVSSTRIGIAWESIGLTIFVVFEIIVSMLTKSSIYDTTHITTLEDNIHIGIHCTLMATSQHDTTIIVRICFVVFIIKFSININGNSTLDWHIRCTHQSIYLTTG